VYNILRELEEANASQPLPLSFAVAQAAAARQYTAAVEPARTRLRADYGSAAMDAVRAVVAGGVKYFETVFGKDISSGVGGKFPELLIFYKHARMVDPFAVTHLQPSQYDVDALAAVFPVLGNDAERVERLKAELPKYMALASSAVLPPLPERVKAVDHHDAHVSKWYVANCAAVKEWAALFRDVCTVSASSASAERVFSVLSNSFGDTQTQAEDYVEVSVQGQFNERKKT
jgi:hypothetical protein